MKLQTLPFFLSDINECQVQNGGCSHDCTNQPGKYVCECPDDLSLGEDGATCQGEEVYFGDVKLWLKKKRQQ